MHSIDGYFAILSACIDPGMHSLALGLKSRYLRVSDVNLLACRYPTYSPMKYTRWECSLKITLT